MSIHEGHRGRLKKRFLEYGLESFEDHSVLELLLFYALPRSDVNPIAHALINKFGSLAAVFDAPLEELARVPGIGVNTAEYIKLIPQISRRYLMSRASFDDILDSTKKAGAYLLPRFYAERDEIVYLVCLDAKCKVLNCKLLFRGSVNSAGVSIRKIVENALVYNSTSVIIAHNHTSGIAVPSEEDKITTRRIQEALRAVDITLSDHIIVADDDFVSLADNGFFRK
ncbi:MAG: DNA repair protein RadC [Clostridiales bacterium]|nr:DNA repair protein RadC [Clostridiales bacterium]